jgi:hypothetical protein
MNPAVADLWNQFREKPLPENLPEDLRATIDIELLDTTARDAIQSYVFVGSLDSVTDGHLRACLQDLTAMVPQLTGETADYFREMRDAAELIVGKSARMAPPPGMT